MSVLGFGMSNADPVASSSNIGSMIGGQTGNGYANPLQHYANMFTGNLDWERQNIMQNQENDYDTMMSNSAVRRRVADMKQAGINPALAVEGGFVGSTPTSGNGSTPQSAYHHSNLATDLWAGSSAYNMYQNRKKSVGYTRNRSNDDMRIVGLARIAGMIAEI